MGPKEEIAVLAQPEWTMDYLTHSFLSVRFFPLWTIDYLTLYPLCHRLDSPSYLPSPIFVLTCLGKISTIPIITHANRKSRRSGRPWSV